jgi:alkanesulfonate monooxygenase SsuD/methylene tetrahydromethanopterin reductase-like flavin-dependent oxidoreductase (luciferase family)
MGSSRSCTGIVAASEAKGVAMSKRLTFGAYALPSYHAESDPPQADFVRQQLDLLAAADSLGFDSVWINEHHFDSWGGLMSAPHLILAGLSQRTEHIRLGTSIAVLGLHHPLATAEQMATLDLMSGGRLEFGIGRGSEPFDYETYGVDYAEAQGRTEEALDVILAAWTNKRFSHSGTYFEVHDVELWPSPKQQPHPPVWVSCSSTRSSFEWTARRGYNLLTLGFPRPVPAFAETVRMYRDEWQAVGRDPADYQIGTLYHTIVCEKSEDARDLAARCFARFLAGLRHSALRPTRFSQVGRASAALADLDMAALIHQARLIAGNPQEVADMLRYLQSEIGFTHLNHMFQFGGLSFELAQQSMALYAAEVMPRLRATTAPPLAV